MGASRVESHGSNPVRTLSQLVCYNKNLKCDSPAFKRVAYCLLVLLLIPLNAIATSSGMTAREAFSGNERVAAMVEAVRRGDYAESDRQLKAGANVNTVGNGGISPLMWLMIETRRSANIEYLLKVGADPNYRSPKDNVSAMYFAAGGNRLDLLELLLKYKGNPSLVADQGESLLHLAVMQSRDNNIEVLLAHGADINAVDSMGDTVGTTAVALGRFDLVAHFLERGLNHDLERLARRIANRAVPPDSEQQRWKDKAVEMLKARGVRLPAVADPYSPQRK
jgi:hypothetical protein